jgi:hypothetical protein
MPKNKKAQKTIDLYWNCECPNKYEYIHARHFEDKCYKCGAVAVDQPDSIASEVVDMFSHKKGDNKRR